VDEKSRGTPPDAGRALTTQPSPGSTCVAAE
jgi:hypothetical protein